MLNRKRKHRKSIRGPYPAVIVSVVIVGIVVGSAVGTAFGVNAIINSILYPEPDITIPIIELV